MERKKEENELILLVAAGDGDRGQTTRSYSDPKEEGKVSLHFLSSSSYLSSQKEEKEREDEKGKKRMRKNYTRFTTFPSLTCLASSSLPVSKILLSILIIFLFSSKLSLSLTLVYLLTMRLESRRTFFPPLIYFSSRHNNYDSDQKST